MQKTDKLKLKKQIELEASKFETFDDMQMAVSLLTISNTLLKGVERTLASHTTEELPSEIESFYLAVTAKIKKYYDTFSSIDTSEETSLESDITRILEEIQNKQNGISSKKSEYSQLEQQNIQLQQKYEEYQLMVTKQHETREGLNNLLSDCSQEKIDNQKAENQKLLQEIGAKQSELDDLKKRQQKLQQELREMEENIAVTQKAIDAVPKKLVTYRTNYKQLREILTELKNASVEYSPEKQKQLQDEIDELTPVVEKNKVATEMLTHRKESLEQQKTEYDTEKQTLTSDLLERVNELMRDLKSMLDAYDQTLSQTEKIADTLTERLKDCQNRRDEYAGWYESVKTPLDAMIDGINMPENESLRKTLDVNQIPEVKKAYEMIRQNLLKLDQILESCAQAAKKDLERIQRRARN